MVHGFTSLKHIVILWREAIAEHCATRPVLRSGRIHQILPCEMWSGGATTTFFRRPLRNTIRLGRQDSLTLPESVKILKITRLEHVRLNIVSRRTWYVEGSIVSIPRPWILQLKLNTRNPLVKQRKQSLNKTEDSLNKTENIPWRDKSWSLNYVLQQLMYTHSPACWYRTRRP